MRLLLEPGAVHVRWAERDLSTMPPSAEVMCIYIYIYIYVYIHMYM